MVQHILNEDDQDPLKFDNLFYIRKVEQSKGLNHLKEPCVIVSASGMCEGGRILHHLKNNIEDSRNTILFTGYQAPHTLGRRILDGDQRVRIFGDDYNVRAKVTKLEASSGHADQPELLKWALAADGKNTVRRFALVHTEMPAASALKQLMNNNGLKNIMIPDRSDRMELE
jgi:metallo-beta-lactamase family protein